jgi:chorismate dehydratase
VSRRDVPALRLGVVPYLNVQPMIDGLAGRCPSLTLVSATPRDLDRLLASGEVDLGIAPTFCAFVDPERAILPAPVIASDGAVRSVVIVAQTPLKGLRRVYRDPRSMTSNALAAILADRVWNDGRASPIEFLDLPPGPPPMPEDLPRDAGRLLIGDPALRERPLYPEAVDLGQAWREWTGLPFVFAAWIGPAGRETGDLAQVLEENCKRNHARLDEIAASYDALPEMPPSERARYLRENLTFRFGPGERQAVERFHAESVRLGLIPQDSDVRWMTDPSV